MAEQYVSIKIILDRITRHPLLQDIPYETVVDLTVDFMRIVGIPSMFVDPPPAIIEINDYRGLLPCDWYDTVQIREKDTGSYYRHTTDTFYRSDGSDKTIKQNDGTFSIQGNIIYTSMKKGILEMAYKAIKTDDEGTPMIPDNSNFFRALESYIKVFWFTILSDMGKVSPQSLATAKQDYAWAVGSCETDMRRFDLAKAESFFNSFRTLIVRDQEFTHGFRANGAKEILKGN